MGESMSTKEAKIMTEDDWEETYKPIRNHLDDNASWNNTMFETYGDEIEFVRAQPDEKVWTWMDGDEGGTYLASGYHYVNRIGHFVCSVPWTEEAMSITIDEPEERCNCCCSVLEDCECNETCNKEVSE